MVPRVRVTARRRAASCTDTGMAAREDHRSIAELLAELAGDTTTLIRKEIELARAELTHNVARMAGGAVTLGVGGVIALLGAQALVACAILVGTRWLDAWLSALAVGGALLLIGIILMLVGRRRLDPRSLTPRRTLSTLRQDRAWAKEQLHERL